MDDLTSAVRELRATLDESMQAFATRLGISISAVANYERDRAPSGKVLYKLERLARACGQPEIAMRFAKALALEMDWAGDETQAVWPGVVREIVRNEGLCNGWPQISVALVAELEKLISSARCGMHINGPLNSQESNIGNLESWLLEARYSMAEVSPEVQSLYDDTNRHLLKEARDTVATKGTHAPGEACEFDDDGTCIVCGADDPVFDDCVENGTTYPPPPHDPIQCDALKEAAAATSKP